MNIEAQLMSAFRRVAMDRLEAGMRAGGAHFQELLQAKVSGSGGGSFQGKATVSPFLYVDKNGKVRHGRRGKTWQPGGPLAGAFGREGPPGMDTGRGRESIGYQIKSRDDSIGRITMMIGVDASAPGGFTTLPSYLLAWDFGIRAKAAHEAKGQASGAIRQMPWFRVTINQHWGDFVGLVTSAMAGAGMDY